MIFLNSWLATSKACILALLLNERVTKREEIGSCSVVILIKENFLMELILRFIIEQWVLVAALFVCIIMLIRNENQKSGPALSPQEAIKIINQENGIFLDMRDLREFKDGHIVAAINIPFNKLLEQLSQIEKYKNQPIVVVCKMGHQSGAGCKQLKSEGVQKVFKMTGGMFEWNNLQLPVVK